MIVPRHDRDIPIGFHRKRTYIRLLPHAYADDLFHSECVAAFDGYAIAMHQRRHAEDVQHRLVDAIGRQRPETVEVRLVLEFKRPGQHALDVRLMLVGELEDVVHCDGRVARV